MILRGLLVLIAVLLTASAEIDFSTLSEGTTSNFFSGGNLVIRDQDELSRVWSELGIKNETPPVDFDRELVVALVTRGKVARSVEISRVVDKGNNIEVVFAVKPFTAKDLEPRKHGQFPYLVAKLHTSDAGKSSVKFTEDIPSPPIPKDSGIGQIPPYSSMLKDDEHGAIVQFFPLDKGNSWTYGVESNDKDREETYSILSISQDGWSIFDQFFGKDDIAVRVDPAGGIYVSSSSGVQSFYTEDVEADFIKSQFSTPAGKFDDLMIVTIPNKADFWFKDVYAKGVGLIYHERKSPKGAVKYRLIRASVKGKNYP